MLDNIYRQLIMDHSKKKRNFRDLKNGSHLHYKNPTCGDVMTLYWIVEDKTVVDVSFIGEGCSISMASCSMMTELIRGESVEEVFKMREAMERLIRNGELPKETDLGDAVSLEGVHKLRARHNCALMPWQALDRAFLKKNKQDRSN
ncbi:SUF system NifU family Fe-S cluster assembly protein [Bacillus shivajii]|uniref:Fe-S cluster assembly sulfur transfer protein SufU n=1 Tax=Bacillus shivajii TaxID=1983719 RepID=UPI001CFB7770|nr:SUF system NifU family Fe-S cluster assembly protein [Bacillus shivajii]UCZ54205.1 SUF system NifU family Fe-S cluster assembly protein [Bacillus shivajii]